MPNYPIFYTIQNEKDSSTNVFSLSFSEEKYGELRLKHIIKEFPLDLENGNYHIRFKIQCNEVDSKIYAWIDPSNLEARAPIINNAVYVKILQLTKEGDSKLYSKQKIQKAKQSVQNQQGGQQPQQTQQQQQNPQKPAQPSQKLKQQTSIHSNIHHSNSDPDLVHKQHMKSANLLEVDHKDNQKSQFKQKSSNDLDSQQVQQKQPVQAQKTKDIFEDDDFGPMHEKPQPPPKQDKPKSGVIVDFFNSDDDEEQKPPSQHNLGNKNNNQPQNTFNSGSTGQDLFQDDAPKMVFEQHENLIQDHNQAPVSEFEIELEKNKHKYIDKNGEMDGNKLKKVKGEILQMLQEKRVREHEEEENRKKNEQLAKRDAKEKLEQKVKNWKEQNGTRKDIRTLLSTLQNVLWQGAQWAPVSFFDLSTEDQLKSTIKNVLKKFHPDRNRNSIENKYICEQIIDEIKQAQKEYESKQQR